MPNTRKLYIGLSSYLNVLKGPMPVFIFYFFRGMKFVLVCGNNSVHLIGKHLYQFHALVGQFSSIFLSISVTVTLKVLKCSNKLILLKNWDVTVYKCVGKLGVRKTGIGPLRLTRTSYI